MNKPCGGRASRCMSSPPLPCEARAIAPVPVPIRGPSGDRRSGGGTRIGLQWRLGACNDGDIVLRCAWGMQCAVVYSTRAPVAMPNGGLIIIIKIIFYWSFQGRLQAAILNTQGNINGIIASSHDYSVYIIGLQVQTFYFPVLF